MIILITYFALIFLSLIISFPKVKDFIKSQKAKLKVKDFNDSIENDTKENEEDIAADIDELKKIKPFLITQIKGIFNIIFVVINFPVFLLRMALISKFGVGIVWKLPFQLYDIWWLFLYGYCFKLSINGFIYASLILSSIMTICIILEITSNLEFKDGKLAIQKTPEHKLSISQLMFEAILIIIGFASIYFTLSIIDVDSFNQKMTLIDSLYYSFMIGTTVGFGHIQPNSDIIKIISMIEAFLGFMFIVFMVAIFLNFWVEKKTHGEK
jgi:hypothetical protein